MWQQKSSPWVHSDFSQIKSQKIQNKLRYKHQENGKHELRVTWEIRALHPWAQIRTLKTNIRECGPLCLVEKSARTVVEKGPTRKAKEAIIDEWIPIDRQDGKNGQENHLIYFTPLLKLTLYIHEDSH